MFSATAAPCGFFSVMPGVRAPNDSDLKRPRLLNFTTLSCAASTMKMSRR